MKFALPLATSLFIWTLPAHTFAATVLLNSLTDSVTVGLDDTVGGSTVPAAVGDGWFSGSHAGTVRQRKNLDQEPLRTQWFFRFDISALSGISPTDITGVTINIPQIGRLNSNPGLDTVPLRIFDVNASWDTTGSNYPIWNLGREAPSNTAGSGGTLLASFSDAYDTFGTARDVSNPNVEGVFSNSSADLLATVQSWAASGTNNEGLMASLTGADNIGLAFGTPTIEITYVPEPSASILLMSSSCLLVRSRRRRVRRS